ncbi:MULTISPECIES: topoisomerase IV [Burkholderia]|uniref:topoisomerase IV n=1 Tax=Burkholderia TaxID=32008 RepID=UPI000863B819|nr:MULTISPECIES: topoisomerase IV [Burkholderia]AOL03600.1 topoisomerase IV [Burkholderia contaminans]MCA7888974.1 topoisomerase IV [Burkholderia contaminans]TCW70798.1 topoisomerase IV [Burkholderia sp. SRS-25]
MTVPHRNTRLKPLAASLAALGALAVLTALSAMSPVYAAEPAQPDPLLKTFIHDTYGNWRADRKGWQADEDDFVYAPCGSLRVATADGPRTLLAMCGETAAAVQNGMPGMDSDATTGTIDLYVLKPAADGKMLEPVMKKTEIASGGRGEPGTVRIERLGPHLFGFVIGESDTRQGYSQSFRAIWLPVGNALVLAAARIDEALDNAESTECANARARCEERRFEIAPDTTGAGDVYPLMVTETGTRGDKTIRARHTVKFDAARGRYVVPKALREGY